MKRMVCLALCLCIMLSLVPGVSAAPSAESLSDCTVEVLFGAALTKQNVKQDAEGVYYAPITWISYFGPNVVHKELPKAPGFDNSEGWHCFYLKEQEEYGPFARRTFINEKTGDFKVALGADLEMQARFVVEATDYGTWKECTELLMAPPHIQAQLLDDYFSQVGTQVRRIDEQYICFTEGKFSSIVELDGEFWVPMNEILALTDVVASVTGDGKYLCMQPVQDSLLRFLYRRWDELWPLVFGEDDLVGEDIMAAGGWIVATASGRGGFGIGGKIQSYSDLFTTFLTDDEAYLAAFDAEANPDMEYMGKVSENAGEINNIFKDISKELEPYYQLIISGETKEMQEHYKSYFTPGKAASTTIGVLASLGQYAHVYMNQINDHREMLDAVFLYNADPTWSAYVAAKSVVNSYREGAQKIQSKFWEIVGETTHGLVNDAVFGSVLGPWYLYLKVGTLFMGEDYQYILDSSHVDENIEVSQYAYHIFKERIFNSQLKGLHPNAIRLSLMLSLVSSRHAYKTYWAGTDYKTDTIAKIDEILAELYTAGRWQDVDAKDIWYVLKGGLEGELEDLLPADGNADTATITSVQDFLMNITDPATLPDGMVEKDDNIPDLYFGSYGDMTFNFTMGTDENGQPCITHLCLEPGGEAVPVAYGLTSASTVQEFIDGMEDLCESTLVPLPEIAWPSSWFGPYMVYSNSDVEQYEASNYWLVGSRVYQIVLVAGTEGYTAPDRIEFLLYPYA